MTVPKRVQLREADGWRVPDGAVDVSASSKWANPVPLVDVGCQFPSVDDRGIARMVVRDFETLAARGRLGFPNWRFLGGQRGPVEWTYPPVEEIRAELAGRDLACDCEPGDPCHGDVLLEIANAPVAVTA